MDVTLSTCWSSLADHYRSLDLNASPPGWKRLLLLHCFFLHDRTIYFHPLLSATFCSTRGDLHRVAAECWSICCAFEVNKNCIRVQFLIGFVISVLKADGVKFDRRNWPVLTISWAAKCYLFEDTDQHICYVRLQWNKGERFAQTKWGSDRYTLRMSSLL